MAARCSVLHRDGAGRGTPGSRDVLQHRSHTAVCVCVPAASQPLKRSLRVPKEVAVSSDSWVVSVVLNGVKRAILF